MIIDYKKYNITKERLRPYIFALIIYAIISFVMFWNLFINTNGVVVNGGGDVYQSLWGLWWVPFSTFVLHSNPYITNMILYPVGANLATQTMTPLAGLIFAPLQAIGLSFEYNFLLFTSFILGGIFMFMLAKYLVKDNYAAFLAGLIFAFSPVHIAQSYSHLQWTITEFIPLFVLFFIIAIKDKKLNILCSVLGGLSLVLVTFMGDIEQGIMMIFFAIVSIIILLIIERKEILKRITLYNLGLMIIVFLIFSSPFIYWFSGAYNSSTINTANQLNGIANNMLYSDPLVSFFLPSYYNGIFHDASLSYFNQSYALSYQGIQYSSDVTEKIAYIGFTVLALVLFALYHEHKKNRLLEIKYWLIIGIIFGLLALGPILQITDISTGIPSLYSAYKILPIFNVIREPGRFDFVVTLALAILAAFGFKNLREKVHYVNKNIVLSVIGISILILIEYNGMPLSGSFANQLSTNSTIPYAFKQLGIQNLTNQFSILMLPALPSQETGYLYPGLEMYYDTAAKIPLVGGYPTRINATQQQLDQNIPLAVSALYLQTANITGNYAIQYPSPIIENYSDLSLLWLEQYRVGLVVVLKKAYNTQAYYTLDSYLTSIFGQPYQDNNLTAFYVNNANLSVFNKTITSYIIGTWIPGYTPDYLPFCNSQENCVNDTYATAWWGGNIRGIMIFSPKAGKIKMTAQILNTVEGNPIYLDMNNAKTPIIINATNKLENYSVILNATYGVNQLLFYQNNSTKINNTSPYLNYGVDNITFEYNAT
ncbi:MAG: hypothetical protein QXD23_01945 [Candidatus Micrarchaeaceae archaeon]